MVLDGSPSASFASCTAMSSSGIPPSEEEEERILHLQRHAARQQIATPLSLLVFIVAAVLGSTVAHPSLKEISDTYLTVLTPTSNTIGGYWIVLGCLLVGQ